VADLLQSSVWHRFTQAHVRAYRLSGGRLGGKFRGAPVLLLNHVGRKSGQSRTSPLLYLRDGEDFVVVASSGGAAKHPVWWLNLREQPSTTVEVGSEKYAVRVRQANAEEKARLWPKLVEMYSPYADYQKRTSREIPVAILEPT
jgi:deazaflavin-dependent oxidoreductase (nitroreductase family)